MLLLANMNDSIEFYSGGGKNKLVTHLNKKITIKHCYWPAETITECLTLSNNITEIDFKFTSLNDSPISSKLKVITFYVESQNVTEYKLFAQLYYAYTPSEGLITYRVRAGRSVPVTNLLDITHLPNLGNCCNEKFVTPLFDTASSPLFGTRMFKIHHDCLNSKLSLIDEQNRILTSFQELDRLFANGPHRLTIGYFGCESMEIIVMKRVDSTSP